MISIGDEIRGSAMDVELDEVSPELQLVIEESQSRSCVAWAGFDTSSTLSPMVLQKVMSGLEA